MAAAAIHGSWAEGSRRPDSDIDVIVVGATSLRDLRRRTRGLAHRAGRRVDVTLFEPDEFRSRLDEGHGFARHLLDEPVIPLIGDLREIAAAQA